MKSVHSHNPHDTPLVEWRHVRVGCAVLEFQSGQCHFGSSPRHFLGRIQRELPAETSIVYRRMQEGDQEEEEPLPLLYQVPLPRLLSWSRWRYITSRVLLIAYQKRFWALTGNYLKLPEVLGVVNPHLAHIRLSWGRGRGRLLRQLSDYAPK